MIENDEVLDVGCAREKVVAAVRSDAVSLCEHGDITCLSDRVAAQVDDAAWSGFEKLFDNVFV